MNFANSALSDICGAWLGLPGNDQKREHKGVFHKISEKHRHRDVMEFAGKHNVRELDTEEQKEFLVRAMVGKRLRYRELIA